MSRGPGKFRELREACRNHFHLPWILAPLRLPGAELWPKHLLGGIFLSVYGIWWFACILLPKERWLRTLCNLVRRTGLHKPWGNLVHGQCAAQSSVDLVRTPVCGTRFAARVCASLLLPPLLLLPAACCRCWFRLWVLSVCTPCLLFST